MKRFAMAGLLFLVAGCTSVSLRADTIVVDGTITQSTQDGTGPAVNNPSLNNILDGDAYSVTLDFTGSITAPGTYTSFTGVDFSDLGSSADESSFGSPISLTVLPPSGGMDEFSVLACLTTGSGCFVGNELDLNFMIPSSSLDSASAVAESVPLLTPLDLLEDDGTTDVQASVTSYAYSYSSTPPPTVPEPGTAMLLGIGLAMTTLLRRFMWPGGRPAFASRRIPRAAANY
jgi:hypothetical protein